MFDGLAGLLSTRGVLRMQIAKRKLRKALGAVLGASIVAVLMIAAPAFAHEGHIHKYMGTISSVHERQVTVKTTDGKQVTFTVGDKTEIVRGTTKAGTSDLTQGTRVVVEAEGGKEPMVAKLIRLAEK
jgi:hypothetical protein